MAETINDVCLITNEHGMAQYYFDPSGTLFVHARHGSLDTWVPIRSTIHDENVYYGIDMDCKLTLPSSGIPPHFTVVRATKTGLQNTQNMNIICFHVLQGGTIVVVMTHNARESMLHEILAPLKHLVPKLIPVTHLIQRHHRAKIIDGDMRYVPLRIERIQKVFGQKINIPRNLLSLCRRDVHHLVSTCSMYVSFMFVLLARDTESLKTVFGVLHAAWASELKTTWKPHTDCHTWPRP